MIVVISNDITDDIKLDHIKEIIKYNDELGGKGLEISVVKKEFLLQKYVSNLIFSISF